MDDQETFGVPQASVQCQRLLSMLGEKALGERHCWVHVGQCLYNILPATGKELFERFTVPQFRDQLDALWNSFEKSRHGLGSLKTMALRYNKAKYDEWMESTAKAAAIGALEETAGMTEIADIVKLMYDHLFICTNSKNQDWFHFNGKVWMKQSSGHTIQQTFSRRLSPLFKEIYEAIGSVDGDEDGKRIKKRAAEITRGLKDPGFKAVLMKECSQIFLNESFHIECDENWDILGLPNGVLELKKDRMFLRPAYPEDWITLQMGVPYDATLTWDHVDVQYVLTFYKKVLYKQDLIDFSLMHKSTCLVGGNLDKLLVMNIGTTAHNAKTTCATFDRYVFGTYSGKLPLGLVVGRTPEQGQATPALAGTKGTRLQQLDEPSKKQGFNGSAIKTLTGNDEQWVRALYQNPVLLKLQFTLVMYGNDAPNHRDESGDQGIAERAVWLPHDSRFTMDAPDDEAKQWETRTFKADPHINMALHKRGSAYLWILVEYLKRYYNEGLKKPEEVIAKTKEYQKENDVYAQYRESNLDKTDYKMDYVTLTEMYSNFTIWYQESYKGDKTPPKPDFEKGMKRLLGGHVGSDKRYMGVKIKSTIRNA